MTEVKNFIKVLEKERVLVGRIDRVDWTGSTFWEVPED